MNLQSPVFLSFVIVAIGFAAGVLPFFFRWTHITAHRWIALGAGTLIGAAFLHMLPEGIALAGPRSLWVTMGGFLLLYLVEQLSFRHPHEEDEGEFYEVGFLTFLGLTIHDLIDGISLGSGNEIPELTPTIFLALVLHKIPTTFSMSLLMIHGGYSRRKVMLYLGMLLLAIPAGTLLSQLTLSTLTANASAGIGYLINFSAGTFLYIGAYELLPEMHRKSGPGEGIAWFFLSGIALMALLLLVHPVH